MRPIPTFNAQSMELLNNVDLARRFWQTSEGGFLFEDWKKFCRWLGQELRSLTPSLRDWSHPWVYVDDESESVSVNIEPNAFWRYKGDSAVCLYFSVFPDYFDDYSQPSVGLWVNTEWPQHDTFWAAIGQSCPEDFVTIDCDANADPEYPFWRNLPLGKFQSNGTFDMGGFARAIGEAFESLAAVRPTVDRLLAESAEQPVVAPVGKALILDLEGYDELVEVGLILVAYNSQTGDLAGILDSYTDLRDPGVTAKLPPKITRNMVMGKRLDRSRIEQLIGQAETIISHGNAFDRPRFERLFPGSQSRHWLCSLNGLSWSTFGFDEANLEYLCNRHGISNRDAHRALPDAEALLRLLAQRCGSGSYFSVLLHSEEIPKPKGQAAVAGRRGK